MSLKNAKIYLSPPHMGGTEEKYVQEAFNTNWIAPLGPNVDGFEEILKSYNSIAHCAVLTSGTAAIHLALVILGVKPEDEVLCSTFTFCASANAIAYCKSTPIFIDSERDTWNMCPKALEMAIKERIALGNKPKACILVHLYGMPSKLDEIIAVCDHYQIPIIEDAAESLGSTYKNKHTGTFGELGIYSFNGNKIITTSGGGALVSNNEDHIKKARFLSTQARDDAPHYQHTQIGYNYRMSNLVAGVGRGQMEVLDQWITKTRATNQWYRTILAPYSFISFHEEPTSDYFSNFWLTCIIVDDNSKGITRESIRLSLLEKNIESRPLWKPMHLQPVFKESPAYLNGCSDFLFNKGLCLPSGSNLTDADKNRIHKALTASLQ